MVKRITRLLSDAYVPLWPPDLLNWSVWLACAISVVIVIGGFLRWW
jgi:hypothetical protein